MGDSTANNIFLFHQQVLGGDMPTSPHPACALWGFPEDVLNHITAMLVLTRLAATYSLTVLPSVHRAKLGS